MTNAKTDSEFKAAWIADAMDHGWTREQAERSYNLQGYPPALYPTHHFH